ncbi:hypothetical protein BDY21DRAFT_34751 [Lineolata rhizophorae]|uniref:Uncharacterized protein n=1 Tax=Lineolata rhizophorae TaxID=578093 RepID=A0A6A6NZH2_9PEZI|nr:hypothetical protein BDY21DRAFT_34751 [Lineolata rhizophorae]
MQQLSAFFMHAGRQRAKSRKRNDKSRSVEEATQATRTLFCSGTRFRDAADTRWKGKEEGEGKSGGGQDGGRERRGRHGFPPLVRGSHVRIGARRRTPPTAPVASSQQPPCLGHPLAEPVAALQCTPKPSVSAAVLNLLRHRDPSRTRSAPNDAYKARIRRSRRKASVRRIKRGPAGSEERLS